MSRWSFPLHQRINFFIGHRHQDARFVSCFVVTDWTLRVTSKDNSTLGFNNQDYVRDLVNILMKRSWIELIWAEYLKSFNNWPFSQLLYLFSYKEVIWRGLSKHLSIEERWEGDLLHFLLMLILLSFHDGVEWWYLFLGHFQLDLWWCILFLHWWQLHLKRLYLRSWRGLDSSNCLYFLW